MRDMFVPPSNRSRRSTCREVAACTYGQVASRTTDGKAPKSVPAFSVSSKWNRKESDPDRVRQPAGDQYHGKH